MSFSSKDVVKLRQITGAGMMDCKKALEESGGSIEDAVDLLRKKGIEVAAKRETKGATEGRVVACIAEDKSAGALVEINSETDFAARSDDFRVFADGIARQVLGTADVTSVEELLSRPWLLNEAITVEEALNEITGKIGERIIVRRFVRYGLDSAGQVVCYIHGGDQIGVLMEVACGSLGAAMSDEFAEFAHNIAMQVAAMQPKWVREAEVPQTALDREKTVLFEQARAEGKPDSIIEKMVTGRLKKFYSQVCLLNQPYVRDDSITIEQLQSELVGKIGEPVTVNRFARYQVGEELE